MGISAVLTDQPINIFGRQTRISLKSVAVFGAPCLILGAGLFWYYRKQKKCVETFESKEAVTKVLEEVPKTPLEEAVALKDRGNKLFKAGRFEQSITCYSTAIDVCPEEKSSELSTFYQNRAAAKENMQQYESALGDCNKALELVPKYMKALNRRANLFEKLGKLENALLDATAASIFDQFRNSDNVHRIDRILRKIGSEKAQEEWKTIEPSLPSKAFITSNLSGYSWDPFLRYPDDFVSKSSFCGVDNLVNGTHGDDVSETKKIPMYEELEGLVDSAEPETMKPFYSNLKKSIDHMRNEDYEKSYNFIKSAVDVLGKVGESAFKGDSNHITYAYVSMANLLKATYLTLSGANEESKKLLDVIINGTKMTPEMQKHGVIIPVMVNAMIKRACLLMTIDQDAAGCLAMFGKAQQLCGECPDIFLHRGQIRLVGDQLEDALHDFNLAMKLYPQSPLIQSQRLFALYRRAMIEGDTTKVREKLEEFGQLVKKFPDCGEVHSLYAQILSDQNDFAQADEEFDKVIKLSSDSGIGYAHKALLQFRWKQDKEEAIRLFNKAIEVDPKCELAHELMGQLAIEKGEFSTALKHFGVAISQARNLTDLTHLVSLREGVKAQVKACEKYGISVNEMLSYFQACQERMVAAAMGANM